MEKLPDYFLLVSILQGGRGKLVLGRNKEPSMLLVRNNFCICIC